MKQYIDIINHVLDNGIHVDDRTGVGTLTTFGSYAEWDLSKGFPATTIKKLFWTPVVGELLWFIRGETNVEVLRKITWGSENRKTIWDDNYNNQGKALGYKDGYLGPVYGKQWRNFNGIDQLQEIINTIKNNDKEKLRRLVVSSWNPSELSKMTLPPCHMLYQVDVSDGRLNLRWDQRSVDVFLG